MFSFFRDLLLKNIPLKVIALALAFLVWYYIGQEITDKADLVLRFQVMLPPQTEWQIVGKDNWEVRVALRGPYSDIQRMRAFWNVTGVQAVNPESLVSDQDEILYQVRITRENFPLPTSEVVFSGFKPDAVDVRLVRIVEKTVRVVPVVAGQPEEGYAMAGEARVDPEVVTMRGPRIILKELEEIRTLPVHLNERTSSFIERKRVVTRVKGYDLECDSRVSIEVTIQMKPEKKRLENVRVKRIFPAEFPLEKYSVTLQHNTLDITVEGPKSLLDKLDASKFRILADVAEIKEELKEGESINQNAVLSWQAPGLSEAERSRLKIELGREDLLYDLKRVKK